MSLLAWSTIHTSSAVFWLWILNWGGAKILEGWGAWLTIDWLAARLEAEQLRLYALFILIIEAVWYLLGVFNPEWRGIP